MFGRLVRLDDGLARIENFLIWTSFAFIASVVFIAVIFRYVLGMPFTWTEELITIIFTWMVFLGASSSFRYHQHLRVEVFVRLLSQRGQALVAILAMAAMYVMLGVFCYYGMLYSLQVMADRTPMLELSFSCAFLALPVTSVCAGIHILRVALDEGPDRTFMSITELPDALLE